MTLPEAFDLQFQTSSYLTETHEEDRSLLHKDKSEFFGLRNEMSEVSQKENVLASADYLIGDESNFVLETMGEEPVRRYDDQSLDQEFEIEDENRPHVEFPGEFHSEVQENFNVYERDDMLCEPLLVINASNKTSKYKAFKGSNYEHLRVGTEETAFVQKMLSHILHLNGYSSQRIIEDVNCDLRKDFSYELSFFVRMASGERIPHIYTTSTLDGEELFKNLVSNVTDYFLRSTFLNNHNVPTETRKALAYFNQTPGGANRMKDSDVNRTWKAIEDEDNQVLVTTYFQEKIDTCLHEYLENTFQRTRDSLIKAMRPITRWTDLEHVKLDENLSSSLRSMFMKYAKDLAKSHQGSLDESMKGEIAETVAVAYESFQAIWLLGFRQSIQAQVLNFIKQRLCKLYLNGVKEKKSKTEKKGKEEKAKTTKRVKKD